MDDTTYPGASTSARITCEDCGKYLGMDEGYYDKCPKCRKNIKKEVTLTSGFHNWSKTVTTLS